MDVGSSASPSASDFLITCGTGAVVRQYVRVMKPNWGAGIRAGTVVLVAGVGSVTDYSASEATKAIAVGLSTGVAIVVIEWSVRRFPWLDRSNAANASLT